MLFESFSIVKIFMVFCPLRGSAALTSITRVVRLSKVIVLEIDDGEELAMCGGVLLGLSD